MPRHVFPLNARETWPRADLLSKITAKFDANIVRGVAVDDCWTWRPYKGSSGRPTAWVYGHKSVPVARLALALALGEPLLRACLVCHRCDNGLCVNPAHLYQGTSKDNERDKLRRNRVPIKVMDDDVRAIRAARTAQERKALADRLGITHSYAYAIAMRLYRQTVPDILLLT